MRGCPIANGSAAVAVHPVLDVLLVALHILQQRQVRLLRRVCSTQCRADRQQRADMDVALHMMWALVHLAILWQPQIGKCTAQQLL